MNSPQDDDFPPDYSERIARVCRECANALPATRGDLLAQLRILCRYFEHGEQEGISHGELIDFLGVSTPSVLDDAGYSDAEALDLMKALALITYDEQGKPQAPTTLPPAPSQAPQAEQKQLKL